MATKPKLHRISMVGYTGSPMRLAGFHHAMIVDLSGVQIDGPVPIYRQHDPLKIVGHGEVEIADGKLMLSGVASAVSSPDTREVVDSSLAGFPWQSSIGAGISRLEFVKTGETAQVNGQTVTGPVLIARQTQLSEISFVPRGADGRTSARVVATLAEMHADRPCKPERKKQTLASIHNNRKSHAR